MVVYLLLGSIIVIAGFVIFNLIKKYEILEDRNDLLEAWFQEYYKRLLEIDRRLMELDAAEFYKETDEVGWFFKEIKDMHEKLKQFVVWT